MTIDDKLWKQKYKWRGLSAVTKIVTSPGFVGGLAFLNKELAASRRLNMVSTLNLKVKKKYLKCNQLTEANWYLKRKMYTLVYIYALTQDLTAPNSKINTEGNVFKKSPQSILSTIFGFCWIHKGLYKSTQTRYNTSGSVRQG